MSQRTEIGLAIVGCGTIGRIRAMLARDYPGVGWLGLCDRNADLGQKLMADAKADFFTTDHAELVARPEVSPPSLPQMKTTMLSQPWPQPSAVAPCLSKNLWPQTPENPYASLR